MFKRLFLNENFILCLIVLNAIILFIGGYIKPSQENILFAIDFFITILFIFELSIKISEYGFKKYISSGWNKLDFILVLLSIPSLITIFIDLNIIDVSFLLAFRILRVFRTFRFFKFIPNVNELRQGIQRALKTTAFIVIGFSIYLFIIGILSYYLYNPAKYYSTPASSIYTTFKLFTIEGWFDIPEKLCANYSGFTTTAIYLYFVFIVITGGIIGLSLIKSIFVDSMVSDNNNKIEQKINNLDNKLNSIINKLDNHET